METETVQMQLPKLPTGWKYSGHFRPPERGEHYMYSGEIVQCKAPLVMHYPIVVRAE